MSRARELAGFATATNPIQDLNVGVVTAISFSGDGSSLTGIDATSIKDGDGTVRAQANTSGVVVTGILTATSLEGDGSALTGLPAGLGTAVAATGDGANVYYTNQVLDVGSNLSIDVPATAVVAYTQYPEVAIASGIDLTIADGDDFVADILGIGTTGAPQLLAGGGGRVRADNFVAKDGYNAPTFANGINVSTAATAATFHGDGSALTGMANTSDVSTSGLNVIGIGTFGGDVSIADKIIHTGDTNTAIRFPSTDTITAETAATERLRVTSTGDVGINCTPHSNAGINLQIHGDNTTSEIRLTNTTTGSGNNGGTIQMGGNTLYISNSESGNTVFENNGSERLKITSTGGVTLSNGELVEKCYINSTAWSTTGTINLDNGMVQYNSANLAGTTNTLDIISGAGINTTMATGDMMSVTCITAVNASTAYVNNITIDGIAATESWVGGSAPSDGGSSGVDTYAFNIIKTGSATFVVVANQVKTS